MTIYRLSENLTYKEATYSKTAAQTGIDNSPTEEELANMVETARNIFQPVRDFAGCPIWVNSFFRCDELNTKIGGARNSQHTKGEALDISGRDKISNAKLFKFIKENLDFDQLIWEYGDDEDPAWIHVSYKRDGSNRKQVLRKRKNQPYERI